MGRAMTLATSQLGLLLRSPQGLPASVGKVSQSSGGVRLPQSSSSSIIEGHVANEIAEKILWNEISSDLLFLRKSDKCADREISDFLRDGATLH